MGAASTRLSLRPPLFEGDPKRQLGRYPRRENVGAHPSVMLADASG